MSDPVAQMLQQRRLSSREKRMQDHVDIPVQDVQADLLTDLTPENISQLAFEVDRTKDPTKKAILQAELDRLMELAQNLMPMGPRIEPPLDQSRAVFNPQDPLHKALKPFPGAPSRMGM